MMGSIRLSNTFNQIVIRGSACHAVLGTTYVTVTHSPPTAPLGHCGAPGLACLGHVLHVGQSVDPTTLQHD